MTNMVDIIGFIDNVIIRVTRRNIAKLIPSIMKNHWKKSNDIDVDEIRQKLEQYSPKPNGHSLWIRPTLNCDIPPDLSIIIPFYNTETFAVRCIESVIIQKTCYHTEIILIDDGSPDSCGDIIDSYAHLENVRIIHHANRGLSGARNAGISIAKGKYLMFLDSDDLLCENAVQILMDTAYKENADIVDGSYVTFNSSGEIKEYVHAYQKSTLGIGMFGFAWGKVIRSSLFDRFCFPEQYYFEDTMIAGVLFRKSEITITIPDIVYKYFINNDGISISSRKKPKSVDTYYIIEELIQTWKQLNIPINNSMKVSLIYQLSTYIYHRTKRLGENILYYQFILSCDLLDKNNLYPFSDGNFYLNELLEAFKNKQFGRWKYAAKYL